MEKCLIVAVADNMAIGVKGGLPWHLSADLKYFKEKVGGLVEDLDGNTLVVHLQKIEQLKDALKTVAIGGLSFDTTNANVKLQMR